MFGSSITWSIGRIGRSGNNAADVLVRLESSGMNFMKFKGVWLRGCKITKL